MCPYPLNTLPCQKFHCAIMSLQQINVPLVHWDEPMLRKFQGVVSEDKTSLHLNTSAVFILPFPLEISQKGT